MARDLETRTTIRAPFALAQRVLNDDVITVLGGRERPGRPRRRFDTELILDLGGGTTVHQVVEVTAGRARPGDDGVVRMPLRWEVPGRHVFPTFDGALELHQSDGQGTLELVGHYDVPLGLLGRLGDAAAGHRIAQQSLEYFVVDLGRRLDVVVDERHPPGALRPAPQGEVIDLRDRTPTSRGPAASADEETPGPELYIG